MISIEHVTVEYEKGIKALDDFSLMIKPGELIVLCGKSGCGKTTATRLINGLIPHFYQAEMFGKVVINDDDTKDMEISEIAEHVGSVFQNPKSQFFNINTTAELAFGCENRGWDKNTIFKKMHDSVEAFGIQRLVNRDIFSLSGGEKQMIACGSIYATTPSIMVLDEPSSNLDLKSIGKLRTILKKLKENGVTIIVSEHRLHYLNHIADRYIYMENGKVIREYDCEAIKSIPDERRTEMGLRMLSWEELLFKERKRENSGKIVLSLDDFHYERGGKSIFHISRLNIEKHSIVGVIGNNGVGKTTFISSLIGLLKYRGNVLVDTHKIKSKVLTRKGFLVMQDVNRQLFGSNVSEEVSLGIKDKDENRINELLEEFSLEELKSKHPATLSGGQKQRLAIASAIYSQKQFLYFDEPTSGLDKQSMIAFSDILLHIRDKAECIFVITHDPELLFSCADFILKLEDNQTYDYYPMDRNGIEKTKRYFYDAYAKGAMEC